MEASGRPNYASFLCSSALKASSMKTAMRDVWFLFQPKRNSNLQIFYQSPSPSTHTHNHSFTHTHHQKKKRWVSVTPSEPQRNMIIASDRLYSPVPRGISLNQQPLLLINLYIYILIYTSFLYFRENYSTYNQKYDIKSRFLAWQKRNKCKKKKMKPLLKSFSVEMFPLNQKDSDKTMQIWTRAPLEFHLIFFFFLLNFKVLFFH